MELCGVFTDLLSFLFIQFLYKLKVLLKDVFSNLQIREQVIFDEITRIICLID